MTKQLIIFSIVFFMCSTQAQVRVEDDITTESVDIFAVSREIQKPSGLAMVSTLVLPGSGHHLIEKRSSALAYITLDVISLFGAILFNGYSQKMNTNAAAHAFQYAEAQGGKGADNLYWQMVGHYMEADAYNRDMALNRTPDKQYADELSWRWSDEQYKDEYNKLRDQGRAFKFISTFCVGALVVNRVVSFIDIRATTRSRSIKGATTTITPALSPDLSTVSITLQKAF